MKLQRSHSFRGAQAGGGFDLSPHSWLCLTVALLGASTLLKMYHLTAPALDWHSWKQITTLAKARYIYRDGPISFFVPRVDLFTGLDVDSNKGFGEVPILHLLIASGYWLVGGEAEWVGRLWLIAFSVLGGVYLAALVRGRVPTLAAIAALAIYALSPMNTFYHRTFITDVPMGATMTMGMYHFVRWMEDGRPRDGVWCAVGTAFAALFKVYALFIGVAYVWVIVRRKGWPSLFRPGNLAIGAGSVLPIAAWLAYGYLNFPDKPGVGRNLNASTELLGSWSHLWNPDYYAALWARMGDFTLTPFLGLAFLASAIAAVWGWSKRARAGRQVPPASEGWTRPWPDWLVGWWLGILVYFVIVREGNHEHEYYQMCLLTPLAIGAGLGVDSWWNWIGKSRNAFRTGGRSPWRWPQWVTIGLMVLSLTYALIESYGKYKLAMDSFYAGKAVAAERKDDEKTLVLELGGLRHQQILYYTGGRGWFLPLDLKSFSDLQPYYERGARFIAVGMLTEEWNAGTYPVPLLNQWAREGRLKVLAQSGAETDRYGRPRTWAVWRIVE